MHVRLWCSSQKTERVIECMQNLGAEKLEMDRSRVMEDVQSYLDHVKNEVLERISDSQDKILVDAGLTLQAGTNFRWAYMMAESLCNCKQPSKLVEKVMRGLPLSLRSSYKVRLE